MQRCFATLALGSALGALLGCGAVPPGADDATAPPPPALAIYREAVAAVTNLPEELQPIELAQIADREAPKFPSEAVPVYRAAFERAAALGPPASNDDALGIYRTEQQARVERIAVRGLAGLGPANWKLAHELAQTAVSPRGTLYDALLQAAELAQWGALPVARQTAAQHAAAEMLLDWGSQPPPQRLINLWVADAPRLPAATPDYDVVALARECHAADGSFPWFGVWTALASYPLPTAERHALIALTLQAAAATTDPGELRAAGGVINDLGKLAPDQQQVVRDTVTSLLARLADGPVGSDDSRWAGYMLLTALAHFDQDASDRLWQEYPQFRLVAADMRQLVSPTAPDLPLAARLDVAPPPTDRQALLLRQAMQMAVMNAARPADGTLALVTPETVAPSLQLAARFAELLAGRLGRPDQADVVIQACLDAAERQALEFEREVDARAPADRPPLYAGMIGFPADGEAVEVYSDAARLAFDLTLGRARYTSSYLLKPLLLARAADGAPPN